MIYVILLSYEIITLHLICATASQTSHRTNSIIAKAMTRTKKLDPHHSEIRGLVKREHLIKAFELPFTMLRPVMYRYTSHLGCHCSIPWPLGKCPFLDASWALLSNDLIWLFLQLDFRFRWFVIIFNPDVIAIETCGCYVEYNMIFDVSRSISPNGGAKASMEWALTFILTAVTVVWLVIEGIQRHERKRERD